MNYRGQAKLYYLYMMSDGEVSDGEKKLFDKICKELYLDADDKKQVKQECKGVKAGIDQKEASDTNKASEYKVEHAKNKVNESRKNCGTAIDKLGERKVAVLDGSIKKFISEFEKLNHVELSESSGLNELPKLVLDKTSF